MQAKSYLLFDVILFKFCKFPLTVYFFKGMIR